MDKNYEAMKEILEDQIKKIVKKGDISPQELDNLYKASAIVLDFETKEAMKKAGEPLNAGKIAELTGLDRKVVDKTMTAMKKEGTIVSPVRCKWEPAEK